MEFFLDWAWNRVASIKQRADKETLLLFDHSCLEVPDTIRMTLVLQCRQLQNLKILFEEAKNLWRHGALEVVENKCSIIHLVSNFFIKEKKNLNQSMTSVWPPKIVQIPCHPVA